MSNLRYLLGIDGGQTGTRALLAQAGGSILGEGTGGSIKHLFKGEGEETRAGIHEAILGAFSRAGLEPGRVESVACGISGIQPGSPECARVEAFVREVVPARRVMVVPDYVTSLLGASDGGPGVVVVAGGGSIAYGRTAAGKEAVAGGWGYLLGDEGSGYDIGRRAITAAIRAEDGRSGPTVLQSLIKEHFELEDLVEIKRMLYVPSTPRQLIAALVPSVAALARSGDVIAAAIMNDAGAELATSAVAVLRRLFSRGDPVPVYPVGGVFQAGEVIERPFREALAARWPDARVRKASHSPLMGAVILARSLLDP